MKKMINLHIWCGSDVVSEFNGIDKGFSRFNYPLKGEAKEFIEDALLTIHEHHPGKVIWVESNFS